MAKFRQHNQDSENPVMTTKSILQTHDNVEIVSQPSAAFADDTELPDVGTKFSEPELKTVSAIPSAVVGQGRIDIDAFIPSNDISEISSTGHQTREELQDGISSGHIKVNQLDAATVNDFMSAAIVARPMRLPNHLDVRAKDPNWVPRWVNFKAQGGSLYSIRLGQGFRNAEVKEIVGLAPDFKARSDGAIINNDTILMIAPKSEVFGAYKYNAMRSVKMVSRKGAMAVAKNDSERTLNNLIQSEGISPNNPKVANKIKAYVPSVDEVPGLDPNRDYL